MKKQLIAIGVLGAVLIALIIGFGVYGGNGRIGFEPVSEKEMPRELEAEIIPNYRDIERALACRVGDDVYVLAMRGEKPTSGYEIQITDLELVSEKQGTKLIVYADFADPAKPENMARVKSYPVSVVKAELSGLPDKIELKSSYPKG
ncbi:MAG: protease complex subunit PrcB family protein [Firmicutes bacterium]|nr:protease complex subunit PrcB family protein [Bacillota bacterium]